MATQTGPDLSPAEEALENLMDDVCQLWRDTGDVDDIESGTLDPVTFEITASVPSHLVYDGRCKLSTVGPASRSTETGGAIVSDDKLWLSFPLTYLRTHPSAEPKRGDVAVIVGSRRDPAMVGTKYVVDRVIYKTLSASRRCVVIPAVDPEASM